MSTYQTQFFDELAAGHDGPPIPSAKRAYFQRRLKNKLFGFVLSKFSEQREKGLTKAKLARRIGKTDDVVNRWLGAPSNLTLDTVSDLLLGICAEELIFSSEPLLDQSPRNSDSANWIRIPDVVAKTTSENPAVAKLRITH